MDIDDFASNIISDEIIQHVENEVNFLKSLREE